eukprot:SAG31_NODE_407_length_16049_cov_46.312915_17_plen_419_part_00
MASASAAGRLTKSAAPSTTASHSAAARAAGSKDNACHDAMDEEGAVLVSTGAVESTDLYYVAVFLSERDASEERVLTLQTSDAPTAVIAGLLPGAMYWFRWRAHNKSAPTTARGWRPYGEAFPCRAGEVNFDAVGAPGLPSKSKSNHSEFMYLYRVSEYTDDVDFLPNHNSASLGGQAGFLTNTDSSLFFNFNTTAISRYCVQYIPLSDKRPFADYVSCNGPEGRRWGNTPENPICICDVYSDRMIAHQTAQQMRAANCHSNSGCTCDDGNGGPPAANKTSRDSHWFIGRDPQYLPYAGPCCPSPPAPCPSCWDPAVQRETGGDYSTPKAGRCKAPHQPLGADPWTTGSCTWREPKTVDVIYGSRDLRPYGWQFAPGEGHRYPRAGENTTAITLANIEIFRQAWQRFDTRVGRRCCGC